MARLKDVEWVSSIEPPPCEGSRAETVIKYLGRYLTGGPISDGRILAVDERQVTILAREGRTPGGEERQVPLSMSALEFTPLGAARVARRVHEDSPELARHSVFGGRSPLVLPAETLATTQHQRIEFA